ADKLGCSYDKSAAGMFVWAKLPKSAASSEAYIDELLYGKHLFVAPGTVFGTNGEGYIRFSLCVKEPSIEEAINRITS
ncbi:MAG: aminotransferase class I/II-fold pyridoxal phosphate-dependent enzyme, partial [Bacteroidota bacterium]